jgi:hypothetical protein
MFSPPPTGTSSSPNLFRGPTSTAFLPVYLCEARTSPIHLCARQAVAGEAFAMEAATK